jgi:hypothetical protein
MRAMKIRPVMADVRVVVGAPVAAGMTSVTDQIGVVQDEQRQQRWIYSQGWKRSLCINS